MTVLSQTFAQVPASVGIGDTVDALAGISHPSCAAAIWSRQTPQDVQTWLDDLEDAQLPNGRVIIGPDMVGKTVRHMADRANLPQGSERDWLLNDIALLANKFSELMSARFLRLRLDVVTTNACRKFHMDAITARLICTYRGSGTQYGVSKDGGDPDRVFAVQTGSAMVMRGTAWPTEPASGLLHRSPPIEGTGETRLVLVLDPMTEPHEEL